MIIIENRYQCWIELYSEDPIEGWLAEDLVTGPEDLIQLHLVRGPKATNLVHNIIQRRAAELMKLNLPGYVPLINYGYDGRNSCYYFVYEQAEGPKLETYIRHETPSLSWCLGVLISLAQYLAELSTYGLGHGSLDSSLVIVSPSSPAAQVMYTGLADLKQLAQADRCPDVKQEESLNEGDVDSFLRITAEMMSKSLRTSYDAIEETLSHLPEEAREVIKSLPGLMKERETGTAFSRARRVLERAKRQIEGENVFYLTLTDNAMEQLCKAGFIREVRDYAAASFLRGELQRGAYAWAQDSREGNGRRYRLTTSQMRLWCAPDRFSDPPNCLVVVGIEIRSPSKLALDQENGFRIDARLDIQDRPRVPDSADVTPLLEDIETHVTNLQQVREEEMESKSRFEIWDNVLTTQERLLRAFQLKYVDWEVSNDRGTAIITLAEAPNEDKVDLTADDMLCLTYASDHQRPIGYFEDLSGDTLIIGLRRNVDIDRFKGSGVVTINNAQANAVISRQKGALNSLRFQETVNPNLPAVLVDPSQIERDRATSVDLWFQGFLDPSQSKAVRHALATRDLFLVQGPPGTGKTSVIAEIVLQIIEREEHAKILVSSQSNVAVNHALGQILELRPDLSDYVVRVGREEKVGQTEELLLDRQLHAWRDRVIEKSSHHLSELERKVAGNERLTDALGVLEECQALADVQQERESELEQIERELGEVEAEYDELQGNLNRIAQLRQQVEGVLETAATDDERLREILRSFEHEYLDWATAFLEQANEIAGISFQRKELRQREKALTEEVEELVSQIEEGKERVNEFLRSEFDRAFDKLVEQRKFIDKHYADKREEMARLGRLRRLVSDWQERVGKSYQGFASAYLAWCKIVGATCIGVAGKEEVGDLEFDWVIIDEAGRATPPELLVPMVRGRRIVLVGDHRQLPPIIGREMDEAIKETADVKREALEVSLFQDLIEQCADDVKLPLTVQYRMHPAIGTLIDQCFYPEIDLENGVEKNDRHHNVPCIPRPVVWYSTKSLPNHREVQAGYSRRNQAEVDVIIELVDRINGSLSESRFHDKTLGIITGYLAQKAALRQKIDPRRSAWSHLAEIEVDTVDAYQGRERDIVIYSVVRSNPKGKIGFLRDERRLNVALSRARELLIIVGDEDVELADVKGSNPFYTVIRHIRSHSDHCLLEAFSK